jgi:hypothetical protein
MLEILVLMAIAYMFGLVCGSAKVRKILFN